MVEQSSPPVQVRFGLFSRTSNSSGFKICNIRPRTFHGPGGCEPCRESRRFPALTGRERCIPRINNFSAPKRPLKMIPPCMPSVSEPDHRILDQFVRLHSGPGQRHPGDCSEVGDSRNGLVAHSARLAWCLPEGVGGRAFNTEDSAERSAGFLLLHHARPGVGTSLEIPAGRIERPLGAVKLKSADFSLGLSLGLFRKNLQKRAKSAKTYKRQIKQIQQLASDEEVVKLGCSNLRAGGQRFESAYLHQSFQ